MPEGRIEPDTITIETTVCTSCGTDSNVVLGYIGEYGVRRCVKCSMVYVSPRPSLQMTESIYDLSFFNGTGSHGNRSETGGYQANSSGHEARAAVLVNMVRNSWTTPGGRWLDLGCGPGYLVSEANKAGFQGVGIDISPDAVQFGRDSLNLDIYQGQAECISQLIDPPLSVISMIDSIFHVRDVRSVLKQIYDLLDSKGVFFGGPFDLNSNFSDEGSGNSKIDFSHWGIPEHISFVNQRSMSYLMEDLGYIDISFQPMPLSPSALAEQRISFIPDSIIKLIRKWIRGLPIIQRPLHNIASRVKMNEAGYVLARKP